MNRQELERLIASLTDEELQQIRDYRPDEPDTNPDAAADDPTRAATRRFVKSLLGGGDD
ncbi:hypothetical protein [Mycolicibacterium sp. XJ1904]